MLDSNGCLCSQKAHAPDNVALPTVVDDPLVDRRSLRRQGLCQVCTGIAKDVSVAGAACFATTKEDNSVVSRFALHSSLRQVGRGFSLTFPWGLRPRLGYAAPLGLGDVRLCGFCALPQGVGIRFCSNSDVGYGLYLRLQTNGPGLKPDSCVVLFRGLKAAATPKSKSRFAPTAASKERALQGPRPAGMTKRKARATTRGWSWVPHNVVATPFMTMRPS